MIRHRGAVLILTFIIMITLTAITVGFLYMMSAQLRDSSYDLVSAKALWIAEAGIQQVIYRLDTDSDYRNSPTTLTGSVGDGSFSVSVTKSSNTYTVTSTSTIGTFKRQITQTLTVAATGFTNAFNYAVFGNTNSQTLRIKDEVAISGDVYYGGDVNVDEDASVTNGRVYADSVSGEGTYTFGGTPEPVPTYPTFDTTWYDNQITTAEGKAAGNWELSGSDTYNLNGGTVYYNGEVKIKDNATITGTGTIVATDNVEFEGNANISQNVTVVSKTKIEVKNNAVVQSGAVLYARNEVKLKDNVNVTGSLIVPTNNKKAVIDDSATLTGIIYADKVELKGTAVISGSVVGDEYSDNKIEDGVRITHNQSSLPSLLPTGLEMGSVTVNPQKDWDEILPPA